METQKIAFITGITGMDGSTLAPFLLDKNYIVYGLIRRSSSINTNRIQNIFHNKNLKLKYGDMTDQSSLFNILNLIKNDHPNMEVLEIYNLAAQSHVAISFEIPIFTANVDACGTLYLLEAIKQTGLINKCKMYNAITSEIFGKVQEIPQKETTPFYPRSPYGVAKLYSYWICKNYRESYNMFIAMGILFNHTNEKRGHNFIERKITLGLGKILRGEETKLVVGNINSKRDFGLSDEYIEGMWRMLQHTEPDDFVLSTGETHTIREVIEVAFGIKGFNIKWKGEGINEIGYDENTGRELIFVDKKYYRPCEVDLLIGDATKAKNVLGWEAKTKFYEIIKKLVDNDCN